MGQPWPTYWGSTRALHRPPPWCSTSRGSWSPADRRRCRSTSHSRAGPSKTPGTSCAPCARPPARWPRPTRSPQSASTTRARPSSCGMARPASRSRRRSSGRTSAGRRSATGWPASWTPAGCATRPACCSTGEMKCTFGPGSFLLMNIGPTPRPSASGLLTTVAWQLPSGVCYALDGGVFVTGAAVQWLAETLGLLPDVAASADFAAQSADSTVTFVPALAGLAAPHWRPEIQGAIFGLTRATTPADIARATLEGIACQVYEVVKAMEQDAGQPAPFMKVDGGPSANRYLMQFLADLLQVEVRVAAAREATAICAANLAGHAALATSLDELAARWRAEAVYAPRMAVAMRDEHLERWGRALAAARQFHAG